MCVCVCGDLVNEVEGIARFGLGADINRAARLRERSTVRLYYSRGEGSRTCWLSFPGQPHFLLYYTYVKSVCSKRVRCTETETEVSWLRTQHDAYCNLISAIAMPVSTSDYNTR